MLQLVCASDFPFIFRNCRVQWQKKCLKPCLLPIFQAECSVPVAAVPQEGHRRQGEQEVQLPKVRFVA